MAASPRRRSAAHTEEGSGSGSGSGHARSRPQAAQARAQARDDRLHHRVSASSIHLRQPAHRANEWGRRVSSASSHGGLFDPAPGGSAGAAVGSVGSGSVPAVGSLSSFAAGLAVCTCPAVVAPGVRCGSGTCRHVPRKLSGTSATFAQLGMSSQDIAPPSVHTHTNTTGATGTGTRGRADVHTNKLCFVVSGGADGEFDDEGEGGGGGGGGGAAVCRTPPPRHGQHRPSPFSRSLNSLSNPAVKPPRKWIDATMWEVSPPPGAANHDRFSPSPDGRSATPTSGVIARFEKQQQLAAVRLRSSPTGVGAGAGSAMRSGASGASSLGPRDDGVSGGSTLEDGDSDYEADFHFLQDDDMHDDLDDGMDGRGHRHRHDHRVFTLGASAASYGATTGRNLLSSLLVDSLTGYMAVGNVADVFEELGDSGGCMSPTLAEQRGVQAPAPGRPLSPQPRPVAVAGVPVLAGTSAAASPTPSSSSESPHK